MKILDLKTVTFQQFHSYQSPGRKLPHQLADVQPKAHSWLVEVYLLKRWDIPCSQHHPPTGPGSTCHVLYLLTAPLLACRMAKCGGYLLLGMPLVMMLIASTVEILDGQPTCWACKVLHSVSVCSLLLHLPLHQELPLLRSLDDIDPPSCINRVWWTS